MDRFVDAVQQAWWWLGDRVPDSWGDRFERFKLLQPEHDRVFGLCRDFSHDMDGLGFKPIKVGQGGH